MYTYMISESQSPQTYDSRFTSCRIEIVNTATGEKRVCDDFTYLDDDSQETLEYLFDTNFHEGEI